VLRRVMVMMLASTLGAVTACGTPERSPAPTPPAVSAPPAIKVPPPRPEPPAKRPPAPPPAPPAHADLQPAPLIGLSRDEASALIGPPMGESIQGMASVWDYRQGECRLSLMFYPEVETTVERVLSYEFVGDATTCLNRFRESRDRRGK